MDPNSMDLPVEFIFLLRVCLLNTKKHGPKKTPEQKQKKQHKNIMKL